MHFNPPVFVVPARLMSERRQVKICSQLAINARQHIQVKRRGYAGWIVVRQQLRGDILLQIGPQQQSVTGLQNFANLTQEIVAGRAVEIANRTAQKENEQMVPLVATLRDSSQPLQIWLLVPHDADHINLSQFFLESR